jgi:hypothetical protein
MQVTGQGEQIVKFVSRYVEGGHSQVELTLAVIEKLFAQELHPVVVQLRQS